MALLTGTYADRIAHNLTRKGLLMLEYDRDAPAPLIIRQLQPVVQGYV